MSDNSKLFKHPNQLTSKLRVQETIRKLQTRPVNGRSTIKLPLFITPVDEEDEAEPIGTQQNTSHSNLHDTSTNETVCADYTVHGRCLGFHRPHKMPNLNQTDIPSGASSKINFNQDLNSSLAGLRNNGWNNHLNSMPQWAVKTWLKVCPQKCGDTSFHSKNSGGDSLTSLINESMRETSTSYPRGNFTSFFNAKPSGSTVNTTFPSNSVNSSTRHTTRVRIQQPPKLSASSDSDFNNTPNKATMALHSNVQDNKLESWQVVQVKGENAVCVRGKLMRTRKIWRSGAIKRCKSPRSVISSSGTIYNLVGKPANIDNVMPRYIEESFASGFPPNWAVLVNKWCEEDQSGSERSTSPEQTGKRTQKKKHLKSPVRQRKIRLSLPGEISGSESDDEASSACNNSTNFGHATPQRKLTKKSESLAETLSSDTSDNDERLTVKTKTPAKKSTKPKINKTNSKSLKPKIPLTRDAAIETSSDSDEDEKHKITQLINCSVVLNKLSPTKQTLKPEAEEKWIEHWRIVPVFTQHSSKIKLAGCLKNGTESMSSKNHLTLPVEERLEKALVVVEDGVKYHLIGTPVWIKSPTGKLTLPESIQKKFAKGFPKEWANIIQKYHDETYKLATDKAKTRKVIQERVVIKSRTQTTTTIMQQDVDSDEDMESKSLAGIKVATSSRGRRIIKPLKYWESEKLIVQGSKLYVRNNSDHQLVQSATPPDKGDKKNFQRKSNKPEGKKRNVEESKKKKDPVKAKKPRVTECKSPGKSKVVKEAKAKPEKPKKRVKSKASEQPAEENITKQTESDDHPEFDDLDDEEIVNIMASKPKTKKDRDKKEALKKHLEPKYTHKEVDLFTNCNSASDNDDYNGEDDANDDQWEADSISSRVTLDEDAERISYNYTPPGARMWKLVGKPSSQKADTSMNFEDDQKKKRSKDFVQRQLKKTKTLSKKERAEQEATVSTTAKLMQYKNVNPHQKKYVNELYNNLTSGKPRDEVVAKFLKPLTPIDEDDSDSIIEPYHSEPEDSDAEHDFFVI